MEIFFLLLLILLMAGALASGFPVAFALPGSAILTIGLAALCGWLFAGSVDEYFAQGGPTQWLNAGVTNFRGIYWETERDTLIAIPLFIFMGIMLERSKIAEDLLVTMAQLFGPIPGGLGISVVFVGGLLAATTGIVGATVVAMGLISLPVMLRANYSKQLATGTIAASGTLGQIIPPSIVLIILADQLASATDQASTIRKTEFKDATGQFSMPSEFDLTSTSAGDMFLGALFPGLVLVGLYMAFILALALIRKKSAPPVHYKDRYDFAFVRRVVLTLIPPLLLIFIVLGSIILGVATVNQAGAIGAVGAMMMAGYRLFEGRRGAFIPSILAVVSIVFVAVLLSIYDINIRNVGADGWTPVVLAAIAVAVFLFAVVWTGWRIHKINDTLRDVMVETSKTSALVFIILLGAAMLTAAFRAFGGEDLVKDFLSGLPGGFVAKFLVVMAVIFILGFFLDFIEIAVVVVPIIAPILLADTTANITAVWLGVMIGVNMQTSFLTPPFGFALFYLRGVAPPDVRTTHIYAGVVPFILLQLGALAIVGVHPSLVNYLPSRVSLTAETAPPPRNPRLQQCLEEYVFEIYRERGDSLRRAIDRAAAVDISYLPDDQRRALTEGFAAARATFGLVDKVRETEAAVAAYVPEYRPLHRRVREAQSELRKLKAALRGIETEHGLLSRNEETNPADLRRMEESIARHKQDIDRLEPAIPAEWNEANKRYTQLASAERIARLAYRRNVDDAYEPVAELQKMIGQANELAALEPELTRLRSVVVSDPPPQATVAIQSVERQLRGVEATSDITSSLSQARRVLRNDRDKAAAEITRAMDLFAREVAWRSRAAKELAPELVAYNEAIKGSIGIRSQDRLTSEQADEIAGCLSVHRDISLNF